MTAHDDDSSGDLYLELADPEPDVLDQVTAGALVAAITTAPGYVELVFGYALADRFVPDPRFAEVSMAPGEALALSLELARAAALAARDEGAEPPDGWA
jgi:hypothetical protein